MRLSHVIWLAAALMIILAAVQIGGAENGGPLANGYLPPAWGLDYIGSPEQAGMTYYDYQHNGSMSRMVAYGTDGSVHCAWTMCPTAAASPRYIYYNKRTPAGTWVNGNTGIQVNVTAIAGYCTMDLDPQGNAVIAYHARNSTTEPQRVHIWNSTGEHPCPVAPGTEYQLTWPHVCVDNRGYIHLMAQATTSGSLVTGNLYYTRSQDGGLTWTPWQLVAALGTTASVSQTACADPLSGKVAFAWTKNIATTVTQADVYYVESLDGVTWNFAGATNLTNFGGGIHPDAANSRAYDFVALLYGSTGELHAAYSTVAYPTTTLGGKLWHWSPTTGHRFITGTYVANPWTALNAPGAWTLAIDKPSLGINAAGTLYAQWGQCTTPGDVSSANYGNWDVYATYSTDNGMNWKAPVNVTDTATPGAPAGQCLSEAWANMARVATTKLHVQYIKDLDAGGIPQTQGSWTNNPVIYQGVPVDSIQTIMSIDMAATLPIVIPSRGGTFRYNLAVTNTGYRLMHFDLWLDITLPSGNLQPVLSRPLLTLPPGGTIIRNNLTYTVPGTAPAGNYTFWGHLGTFPWSGSVGKNIWIEDSFPFSKLGVDANAGGEWASSGWDDPENPTEPVESMPAMHLIAYCYPNPFNPTTVISYSLPQTANVTVKVYNVNGGEVAQLVNGWRDAGSHQVTFDASSLASGMYLYRIQAGEMSTISKMLLVK